MKHLKSQYSYEKLSKSEFQEEMMSVVLSKSDKNPIYIDDIRKCIDSNLIVNPSFYGVEIRSNPDLKSQTFWLRISITEMEDEWFLVNAMPRRDICNSYYKCDQLDGLLDCLKHIYQPFYLQNESKSEAQYIEISSSQDQQDAVDTTIDISDDTLSKLDKGIKSKILRRVRKSYLSSALRNPQPLSHRVAIIESGSTRHDTIQIVISELKDEYFYVVVLMHHDPFDDDWSYYKTYKCDQVEGLIGLLKNYGV